MKDYPTVKELFDPENGKLKTSKPPFRRVLVYSSASTWDMFLQHVHFMDSEYGAGECFAVYYVEICGTEMIALHYMYDESKHGTYSVAIHIAS